jgi:adenosylcobinamide-GDP ribazoletransferase
MRPLLSALRLLTILPVPGGHYPGDEEWGRATAWYPTVGLILGTILAGLDWVLRALWPANVAPVLLLSAWVVLTGALHLDGFVDCCDALLAPVPPERRLEILRDVHAGTFGIVGVVLLLLTKVAALAAVPGALRLPGLLLVPVLGRWGMAAAVLLYPYARAGAGLGRRAKTGAGGRQLALGTATAVLASALAWWLGLGWGAPLLLASTAVTTFLTAAWIRSQIGGLTGDAYGAICEIGEVAALLALATLAHLTALP